MAGKAPNTYIWLSIEKVSLRQPSHTNLKIHLEAVALGFLINPQYHFEYFLKQFLLLFYIVIICVFPPLSH